MQNVKALGLGRRAQSFSAPSHKIEIRVLNNLLIILAPLIIHVKHFLILFKQLLEKRLKLTVPLNNFNTKNCPGGEKTCGRPFKKKAIQGGKPFLRGVSGGVAQPKRP
jgi:hypothetical protein